MFRIRFWPMTASPISAISALKGQRKEREKCVSSIQPTPTQGPRVLSFSVPQLPFALLNPGAQPALKPDRPRPLQLCEGQVPWRSTPRARRWVRLACELRSVCKGRPGVPASHGGKSPASRDAGRPAPSLPSGSGPGSPRPCLPPTAPFPSNGDPPGACAIARSRGLGPRERQAAGLARGVLGPGPEELRPRRPGLRAPRGRAQATPGAKATSGAAPPIEPTLGHGPSLTEPWRRRRRRRTRQERREAESRGRAAPGDQVSSAGARLPRPGPRLSGTGQSEERGGAMRTRHWPSQAPVTPPEATVTPTPGADSGERRAHR